MSVSAWAKREDPTPPPHHRRGNGPREASARKPNGDVCRVSISGARTRAGERNQEAVQSETERAKLLVCELHHLLVVFF